MKKILLLSASLIIGAVAPTQAAIEVVKNTSITQVMTTTGGEYGGCMIALEAPNPSLCGGKKYVSVDCDGLAPNSSARTNKTLFDAAMLAKVSGLKANVTITDNVQINGFCTVMRVLVREPNS
jgi:hypothetical protein